MNGVRRILLSPGWWARHALMVAMVAACVLLGRWQWTKALGPHGAGQNFAYGVQWWIFAGVIVYGWLRLIRDDLHPPVAEENARPDSTAEWTGPGPVPVARRPLVAAGQVGSDPGEADPELAAYNDYLTWLNAHPRR